VTQQAVALAGDERLRAERFAVVIVNWNGGELLERALRALERQTLPPARVIVVDNDSTDGSVDGLEERHAGVEVVRLEENVGFAAANNLGARLADDCDWLALLNPDAFPEPGWLHALAAAARDRPEFSFFASRLVMADDPERLDGAGDAVHVGGLAWRRDHGELVARRALERKEVFAPCAAAAVYRRDAFLAVGGFDEDYFCYLEDVDLAFRLRLAGHRSLYVDDAVVRHVGSALAGRESDFTVYHSQRNLVWMWAKNMPARLAWRHLPQHLLVNLLAVAWYAAHGQARAVFRAKRDALRALPRVLRARRRIQSGRVVAPAELEALLERGVGAYVRMAGRARRGAGRSGTAPSVRVPLGTCPACGGELADRPLLVGRDRLHGVSGRFAVAACASCGTGTTLPEATPADLAAFYPEAYGAHDAASGSLAGLVSSALQRRRARRALARAPLAAIAGTGPGRALDVGCGRGDLAAALIRRGWRVTGIEPSEAACAHAAARGVDARHGVLATVPLEPTSYDAAVFQHSLEHTDDPIEDLRRTYAALVPGGLVLVSVPNFGGVQSRRFGSWWFHLDLPRHRTHFTPLGLRRALERAGFDLVALTTSTTPIGLAASVQYRVFGRWMFKGWLAARVVSTASAALFPLARLLDGAGGGDELHTVARKPPAFRR
jgi:GT2 family glycosyltransferase/SAM-dependent methyltransferase